MSEAVATTTAHGSEAVTHGVRVRTWPVYVPSRSDPDGRQYVFSYRVRVSNETATPVTLLARRWVIIDANGQRHEVEGEGVVGRQPTIAPGQAFEYTSFCPLPTAWGTMEGEYTMQRAASGAAVTDFSSGDEPIAIEGEAGFESFRIKVARFYFVSATPPALSQQAMAGSAT